MDINDRSSPEVVQKTHKTATPTITCYLNVGQYTKKLSFLIMQITPSGIPYKFKSVHLLDSSQLRAQAAFKDVFWAQTLQKEYTVSREALDAIALIPR